MMKGMGQSPASIKILPASDPFVSKLTPCSGSRSARCWSPRTRSSTSIETRQNSYCRFRLLKYFGHQVGGTNVAVSRMAFSPHMHESLQLRGETVIKFTISISPADPGADQHNESQPADILNANVFFGAPAVRSEAS